MLSALCFVAVTCFDNVACLAFPAHVWFIDPSAPEEHTAYLGLNLISTVILILQYCSCVIQVFSSMSIWLLLAVACLEPFPQWPCQTAFCGSRAFDRRIDCMYLYFTEKKSAVYCLRVWLPINVLHDCWRGNMSHFHLSAWTRKMLFRVSNSSVQ